MRLTSRLLTLVLLIALAAFTNFLTPVGRADDEMVLEGTPCMDACDRNLTACCQTYGTPNSCPESCFLDYAKCTGKC